MKKMLLNNIKYFILIAILSICFWTFIFNNITAPKAYEKVEIFITADTINENSIKKQIHIDKIKEINITFCNEDDEYYMATLQTIGIISSDILIVKDDLVLTDGATTSFVELDKEYLKKFNINLDDFELIYVNNIPYAIVVFDKSKNINILENEVKFLNEEEIYCITLNNISYHIGKFSTQTNVTTVAFEMLYKILYNNN